MTFPNITVKKRCEDYSSIQHMRSRRRGEIIHLILSLTDVLKSDLDIELFTKKALGIMGEKLENWALDRDFIEPISKFLGLPEIELFSGENAIKVFREKSILVKEGNQFEILRPDRFLVYSDKIVVVDFKSDIPMETPYKYITQVKKYCEILKVIYNKPVHGYIAYIPIPKVEMAVRLA